MNCWARWPCSKPRNESLTQTEDKLLQHLASQAGLVFRNGRLTAELQATIEELKASRRRLVEAQDEERRKIERNLHDGAQQQLVALSIQLGLLEQSADDAASVRQLTPRAAEISPGRARRPPGSRPGHLPAAARRTGPRPGPASPGAQDRGAGHRSRRRAFSVTRRTSRRPCTSAPWRPCRTSPSTPTPPGRASASPAPGEASSSPSLTTEPGSIRRPPGTAPDCKAWPTGWPPWAGRCTSAPSPDTAPRYPGRLPVPGS